MSDKIIKIISFFSLLVMAGMVISAVIPDFSEKESTRSGEISAVLPVSESAEKREREVQTENQADRQAYMYYYNSLNKE